MNEQLVTIARFTDYMTASLAKQRLEDEGIDVILTGENVASTYTGMPGVADVELQTPRSQAVKAKELLALMAREKDGRLEDGDFEEDDFDAPQDGAEEDDESGIEEQE